MAYGTNRHKKIQPILLLVILISLGILIVVFISARGTRGKPQVDATPDVNPDATLSINGVRMTTTREGETAWSLSAKTGHYLDQHKKAIFNTVAAVFFTKEGEQVFLSADEATYNSGSNDLEVTGHVVLKSDQYQMETDHLIYDHDRRVIKSNALSSVQSDTASVTAKSMAFNLQTGIITLNGHISGTIIDNIVL